MGATLRAGLSRGGPKKNAPALPGAFFCVLLLGFAATAAAAQGAPNCPWPGGLPGDIPASGVSRVQDGDSFIAEDGRRIRVIGVNTPELGHRGRPDQPQSREAMAFVKDFVRANPRLILVPGRGTRDNHGRHLVHVYTPEGQNLEALLVARGLGWMVAVPPNLALADCLAELEAVARRARLGVWSDYGTVPATAMGEGGFQRVEGRVERVVFARAWWINLEGGLAGVIYPEHQHRFDRRQLANLEGQRVVVRGWVYPSRAREGKPWRVRVDTAHALELPDRRY